MLTGTYTSNLLIDDYPIQVLPQLAVAIGLNEAIVLQQIHYWLKRTKHIIDGRPWIYNSFRQWKTDNFPFWSERTIRTTLFNLEKLGVIETGNFNQKKYDRTVWYTINYSKLEELKNTMWQILPHGMAEIAPPIPETTTETSLKTEKNIIPTGLKNNSDCSKTGDDDEYFTNHRLSATTQIARFGKNEHLPYSENVKSEAVETAERMGESDPRKLYRFIEARLEPENAEKRKQLKERLAREKS